ncbi:FTR1 family protein [Candidatus Woesebacteria bacterium]|nr:FTR1 family protein [Candidatus Woesebacteria bacterium]MCC6323201.1 FTR1 family protein [Candidatus Nomurabacteria bacterium]
MLPAFLITFREVIEASLIVATVLGILVKLKQTKGVKTVWIATIAAAGLSIILLALGALLGLKVQELYTGRIEELIEGILMVTSAVFITWAVFFLHNYFSNYKVKLLQKVKETVEKEEQRGLFILVFTAVFREGFEIVLFLSTIYFSSNPQQIFTGFAGGIIAGLLISFALFSATLKMPVYYAFRITSVLLILFAAGLLARGVHEFAEAGIMPEIGELIFPFVPAKATLAGDMLKAVFGITQKMDIVQISLYSTYTAFMAWWVFIRKSTKVLDES